MPKISRTAAVHRISLSQIEEGENVRAEYEGIAELAQSIKEHGCLTPIIVKPLEKDDYGIEKYALVAGYRRFRAFKALCADGEGFTSIDAAVVSGDRLTIQLVENLQRSNLTSREREEGVWLMGQGEHDLPNKEIARRLSKDEAFVSRNLAAHKIRRRLETDFAGDEGALAELSRASTRALVPFNGVRLNDLRLLFERMRKHGCSASAAKKTRKTYEAELRPAFNFKASQRAPDGHETRHEKEARVENTVPVPASDGASCPSEGEWQPNLPSLEPAEPTLSLSSDYARQTRPAHADNGFEIPSKIVDVNEVLKAIKEYKTAVGETAVGAERENKLDAANDIIALILSRLCHDV